jgi:hypothetical protein
LKARLDARWADERALKHEAAPLYKEAVRRDLVDVHQIAALQSLKSRAV